MLEDVNDVLALPELQSAVRAVADDLYAEQEACGTEIAQFEAFLEVLDDVLDRSLRARDYGDVVDVDWHVDAHAVALEDVE